MKNVLFVGSTMFPIYVKAFYEAAEKMDDISASLFDVEPYISKSSFIHRVERYFAAGPLINKINKELVSVCSENRYDMVFFYATRLITPKTIEIIKKTGSKIFMYNNDDPFSNWFLPHYWRHYKNSIFLSDYTYVYRKNNIEDARKYGAKRVRLLRSYYIKERNYYIPDEDILLDCPDVVFLGHYEPDERVDFIKALIKKGIEVGVPKKGWEKIDISGDKLVRLDNTQTCYNELLNRAKVAIVFLSKINNDTYTRRCFEIPSVKTMMVAPFNDDIASLFDEKNNEVVFYRDKNDFVNQIIFFLGHEEERKKIAENGYLRLMKDGHEVSDRMLLIMKDFDSIMSERG